MGKNTLSEEDVKYLEEPYVNFLLNVLLSKFAPATSIALPGCKDIFPRQKLYDSSIQNTTLTELGPANAAAYRRNLISSSCSMLHLYGPKPDILTVFEEMILLLDADHKFQLSSS